VTQLREQIQQVIDDEPVALFMKGTPGMVMCGNSMRALGALQAAGAPLTAVDILPDPRIRAELSELSGWPTIPQLFIDRQLVGGCDIAIEMYESGELAEALGMNGNTGNGGAAAPEPAPQEQRPIQIGE
jgi:monothiol glutaredoxin